MVICPDTSLVRITPVFLVLLEGSIGVVEVVVNQMLSKNRVDVIHLGSEYFVGDTVDILLFLLLFFLSSGVSAHDTCASF